MKKSYRKYFITGHLKGLYYDYTSKVTPPTGVFKDAGTRALVRVDERN